MFSMFPFVDRFSAPCHIIMVYGGTLEKNFGRDTVRWLAESLAHEGFCVHRFDFRTNLPGAEYSSFGMMDKINDLFSVYGSLHARASKDPRANIFLLGTSMGGYIATILASYLPGRQSGVILIAPAAYHPDVLTYSVRFGSSFREIIRRPGSWEQSNAFEATRKISRSLLISYEDDDVIPPGVIEKYRQSLGTAVSSDELTRKHYVCLPGRHQGSFADPERMSLITQETLQFVSGFVDVSVYR
ncbi:MAG: hypothetical protein COV31_00600 [Candidatus Yanofskybacteria bacterium CG10_big_fil_rev_8_21_14_0_10_46_23]|uniref:Serine aminopeptidase S33 domain-containing protein n=1 Tax=Candidatus Yanofskybacteria bacterium CG10_big_fil_rev_8_21_14_0_10_46_23 TaxID=1975098 RepID=A0A2H0R510_9BACT|nr:MAG: hypothetical protein COV31_00600 [Candidatus Yanofskybacteria bacterium CG10_big_fil_rev_8_21_14_0_10_46_23]